MSKTYITSDLHFDHANILKYSPWARGHFRDVNQMNEAIVSNINSMVTDQDTLIIAGDICFSSHGKTAEFLKRINGQKKLVWVTMMPSSVKALSFILRSD
jgi:calcineurin-like phosphoesterase family protein